MSFNEIPGLAGIDPAALRIEMGTFDSVDKAIGKGRGKGFVDKSLQSSTDRNPDDAAQEFLVAADDVDAAIEGSLAYSTFQEHAQFHPRHGLFPNLDFSKKGMELLPEMLSPKFGMTFMELFASYAMTKDYIDPHAPFTMLGLGAGGGFLDVDMIEHTQSPEFRNPSHPMIDINDAIAQNMRFIVSDGTERNIELLRKKTKGFRNIPGMKGKVNVELLDATDFTVVSDSQGFVYSNELIDAVPVEPVVLIDDKPHLIRIKPQIVRDGSHRKDLEGREDITVDEYLQRLEGKKVDDLAFMPVFVPLDSDPELADFYDEIGGDELIRSDDHNGLMPLHTRMPGTFQSVLNSFDNGILQFVDYADTSYTKANWLNFIAAFPRGYRFGKHDLDSQISMEQIHRIASMHGYDQYPVMNLSIPILNMFGLPVDLVMEGLGDVEAIGRDERTNAALLYAILEVAKLKQDRQLGGAGATMFQWVMTYGFKN